jgi:hypothetical protein
VSTVRKPPLGLLNSSKSGFQSWSTGSFPPESSSTSEVWLDVAISAQNYTRCTRNLSNLRETQTNPTVLGWEQSRDSALKRAPGHTPVVSNPQAETLGLFYYRSHSTHRIFGLELLKHGRIRSAVSRGKTKLVKCEFLEQEWHP